MIRYIFLSSLTAAAIIAFTAQTASAGCAEEIKEVEKLKNDAIGMNSKQETAYNDMISRAKEALKDRKEKKCANIVKSARLKLHK